MGDLLAAFIYVIIKSYPNSNNVHRYQFVVISISNNSFRGRQFESIGINLAEKKVMARGNDFKES